MASFQPEVHTTEESLTAALMAAYRVEMDQAAKQWIENAGVAFRQHMQEKAAELMARAAIKITSHVSPYENEAKINISVSIPIKRG